MTIRDWLHHTTITLRHADITSARLDAELLLCHALQRERTWLLAHSDELLAADIQQRADVYTQRRLQHEPLAYIRGFVEFFGNTFSVTPDVLIPRPESETILSFMQKYPATQRGRLVDVGTGSGCLGISAALTFPTLDYITLSDVSADALAIAKRNHRHLAPDDRRLHTQQSDLLAAITTPITTVIANLPYVDANWQRSLETKYEPAIALFAEDDGLALITRLIHQANERLSSGNYLILEADPRQHAAIMHTAANTFSHEDTEGFIVVLKKR